MGMSIAQHDLRDCSASWHVRNGTPQELGGWETPAMVRRYAHLAAQHLPPYADRAGIMGHKIGHSPKTPENEADAKFAINRDFCGGRGRNRGSAASH